MCLDDGTEIDDDDVLEALDADLPLILIPVSGQTQARSGRLQSGL